MARKQEIIFVQAVGQGLGTANNDRGVGESKNFSAFLDVTGNSGTAETLNVKFQEWDQASEKWYDIAGAAFTEATGVTNERITFAVNALRIRCVQVIGGSATPTFDFTVGAIGTP
jgi:hypothetical protein